MVLLNMFLFRKCSPVLLLTVCVVVSLSFVYHVTLQYVLMVNVSQRDDLQFRDKGGLGAAVNRFSQRVPNLATKQPNIESNPLLIKSNEQDQENNQTEDQEQLSYDHLAANPSTREHVANISKEITDIYAIRLSLLNDALAQLSHMTEGLEIDIERYNKVIKSNNDSILCQYFTEEGSLRRFSLPRIWSDTGYYYIEDVTLVTQITLDKLGALSLLLFQWSGPVSCSLYLDRNEIKHLPGFISRFPRILQKENIDLHISVKSGTLYPINYLRNLALNYSYTDYVLLMDVDFMPSFGLSEYLAELIPKLDHLKTTVLVLPAMEFTSYAGMDFPKTKAELLELCSLKIVVTSEELHWPPSHKPTNYNFWRNATKPYPVEYVDGYEPYIIGRTDTLPRYNVSFLAGFRDKIQHVLHVHALGLKFTVISEHFAVHIPHSKDSRPPFYECSLGMYRDFLSLLVSQGSVKNHTVAIRPNDEGPKPRKKIVRRIVRKIIRRKVRKTIPGKQEVPPGDNTKETYEGHYDSGLHKIDFNE